MIVTGSVGSALCNEPCPTDICADVYLKSTAGKQAICDDTGAIIPQGLDFHAGLNLQDFGIVGENGANQKGIVFYGATDWVNVTRLAFEHLDQGVKVGELGGGQDFSFMRESSWWDVTMYHCGSAV